MPANSSPLEQARAALIMCNSYEALPCLLDIGASGLDHSEWLVLLGEFWCHCDNISQHKRELKKLIFAGGKTKPIPEMMDESERQAFASLPEMVTIYRGCGVQGMTGASWTLDKSVAMRFPFLHRYRAKEPVLVTARVRKDRIVALKLDREEAEIITFDARRTAWNSICDVERTAA